MSRIITHEKYEAHRRRSSDLYGPHGWLLFVACDAGTDLAKQVRTEYHSALSREYRRKRKVVEIPLLTGITNRFEGNGHDGTCPRLPVHVGGADAFVFQNCMDKSSDSEPLNDNFMQLLQMIRTLKGEGARRVTAITPYFPYSRQDKPSFGKRECSMVRLMADLLETAGVDRTICYHPHANMQGYFPGDKPFNFISGIDLFKYAFRKYKNDQKTAAASVDSGGFKEVKYFAESMGINQLVGMKDRPEQHKTNAVAIGGITKGKKRALLLDDETATLSSCLNMMKALRERGIREFHVGISHLRLSPEHAGLRDEADRLKEAVDLGMKSFHTTDSVPQLEEITGREYMKVHSLGKMWAYVINRRHYDLPIRDMFEEPSCNLFTG